MLHKCYTNIEIYIEICSDISFSSVVWCTLTRRGEWRSKPWWPCGVAVLCRSAGVRWPWLPCLPCLRLLRSPGTRQNCHESVAKFHNFFHCLMMTCSCFENHKQLHKTIYTYIFHEMLALNVNMIRGNEHRWMDCRQNLRRSNWQIGALGDPWGPLGTGFGSTWFGRCFAFTGPRPLPTSVRNPDPNSGRVPIRFAKVHILEVSSEAQISHKTHMILPVSLAKFQSC